MEKTVEQWSQGGWVWRIVANVNLSWDDIEAEASTDLWVRQLSDNDEWQTPRQLAAYDLPGHLGWHQQIATPGEGAGARAALHREVDCFVEAASQLEQKRRDYQKREQDILVQLKR